MTAAWKSNLPAGRKMVLLALCDNANDQGECYPSIDYLAIKCSMGERTVQGHISDMERAGIVRRQLRPGTTTVYHINPRRFNDPAESAPPADPLIHSPAKSAGVRKSHHSPAGSDGTPPQDLPPAPAAAAPRTTSKPKTEPPKNQGGAAAPEGEPSELPEWMPLDAWDAYLEMRKKARKVPTAYALKLVIDALAMFKAEGHDVRAVLDASIRNGWTDVYRPKADTPRTGGLAWSTNDDTVLAKGRELGMEPRPGEMAGTFKARVAAAIENGGKEPPPPRMSRVGVAADPIQAGQAAAPDAPRGEKPAGLKQAVNAALQLVGRKPRTGTDD